MIHCWKCVSWKWRYFIKRDTQYNGCRKNRWSRDLPENGNSWKNDKNKSALHAKNPFTSTEVYGTMVVNLSFET